MFEIFYSEKFWLVSIQKTISHEIKFLHEVGSKIIIIIIFFFCYKQGDIVANKLCLGIKDTADIFDATKYIF
jgi:hypothetical protein